MMKSAAAPKIGTFRTNLPAIPALSARRCSANRLGVPSVHWLGGKDETPRMPFGRSDGSGIERTGGRERRRLVSGIGHGLGYSPTRASRFASAHPHISRRLQRRRPRYGVGWFFVCFFL